MKKSQLNPWKREHEALVEEIMQNYSEDGRILWTRAFEEHPEWKAELTSTRSMGAVFAKGNALRRAAEAASNRVYHPSKKAKGGRRDAWPADLQKIIESIVYNYSPNGVIEYQVAFAEHPEWEQTLLAKKSKSAIYSMGAKILKNSRKRGQKNGHVALENVAVDTEQKPEKPRWEINACPNCALDVKTMNDAYAAKGIAAPPHCPNCTFPLGIARTAIRLAQKHTGLNSAL